jgi:hypothetical protein
MFIATSFIATRARGLWSGALKLLRIGAGGVQRVAKAALLALRRQP